MLLKLTSILDRPGGHVGFQTELDLSDMEFGGYRIVPEPVVVEGGVENMAGVLILSAVAQTTLHCVCARCLKPFLLPYRQEVRAVLVGEETDDMPVDAYALRDECADIDEIATTAFILEMPSRFLCTSDCKGLCQRCGKELNSGACTCIKEPDPRLAALAKLLKSETEE